jgi:hypothetical protein
MDAHVHPTDEMMLDYLIRSRDPDVQHIDDHLWDCLACRMRVLAMVHAEQPVTSAR